jgi:hypothetical protein
MMMMMTMGVSEFVRNIFQGGGGGKRKRGREILVLVSSLCRLVGSSGREERGRRTRNGPTL